MNRLRPSRGIEKFWLALECATLFLALPAVVAAQLLPVLLIPLLVLTAAGCALTLRWRYHRRLRDLWRPRVPIHEWRRVLTLYLVAIPCLTGLLWLIKPAAMFSLLRQHTGIWMLVMFAYPILSVFPQELIYRAFFFQRYRVLFGGGRWMVLASAAVFSYGHIVFHNWPAVVLTLLGGWLFARTYQRTSSFLAVSAEHALYGCAIFTIGYGEFFFDGTLRLFK